MSVLVGEEWCDGVTGGILMRLSSRIRWSAFIEAVDDSGLVVVLEAMEGMRKWNGVQVEIDTWREKGRRRACVGSSGGILTRFALGRGERSRYESQGGRAVLDENRTM